jgi:hypothetical protein
LVHDFPSTLLTGKVVSLHFTANCPDLEKIINLFYVYTAICLQLYLTSIDDRIGAHFSIQDLNLSSGSILTFASIFSNSDIWLNTFIGKEHKLSVLAEICWLLPLVLSWRNCPIAQFELLQSLGLQPPSLTIIADSDEVAEGRK